jgi:glucosyl-dolichyl phosphate glucuronosyltransferase
MNISVAICTWNRSRLLDQTLQGMNNLIIPEGVLWELIVVNNNCTDNTDEIIARHSEFLPIVRIFEPDQGLSNARNAAVNAAKYDYILWTDDDVIVDRHWMSSIVDAFLRLPNSAVIGGKVLPWFETPPPQWLHEHIAKLGKYFALRDFGDQQFNMDVGQNPYGANMAFRTDILRKFSFDTNLGRKGDLLISGEDAKVIFLIRDAGWDVTWIPSSNVKHYLPKERMTLSYLKKLQYDNGRYETVPIKGGYRNIAGYPLWMFRKWITYQFLYRVGKLIFPRSYIWLDAMMKASNIAGRLSTVKVKT